MKANAHPQINLPEVQQRRLIVPLTARENVTPAVPPPPQPNHYPPPRGNSPAILPPPTRFTPADIPVDPAPAVSQSAPLPSEPGTVNFEAPLLKKRETTRTGKVARLPAGIREFVNESVPAANRDNRRVSNCRHCARRYQEILPFPNLRRSFRNGGCREETR